MKDLIPIQVNNNDQQTVGGRSLHQFLGIETRYNDWFSRMLKYGFIENTDFITITQKRVTARGNETTYIDHQLTLDMAKQLAMIQRNDRGRQAREYFL